MTIQVNFEVSRYDLVGNMVQVWGHVGDYEVCVYMTKAEARAKGIIPKGRK